jgi:hypothetical protein
MMYMESKFSGQEKNQQIPGIGVRFEGTGEAQHS